MPRPHYARGGHELQARYSADCASLHIARRPRALERGGDCSTALRMFTPEVFAENDPGVITAMIDRAGLAVLVTHGPDGLFATHLPVLQEDGVLIGHLARQNPHRDRAGPGEALLIFRGPEAYVSPSWYPSKAEHGRAVPTWNYEAVHVYGGLAWFDDGHRLLDHVAQLSRSHEAGREQPWSISDAPAGYIDRLIGGIVGLELRPTRIEAKRKLSQNKSATDHQGVVTGLKTESRAAAALVADLMHAERLGG